MYTNTEWALMINLVCLFSIIRNAPNLTIDMKRGKGYT